MGRERWRGTMKLGFSVFLMVGAGCAVSARLGVMITTAERGNSAERGKDGRIWRADIARSIVRAMR